MDEASCEVTAFTTPSVHYHWLRMAFDLKNAPLTFQRMINQLFSGILGQQVFAYLDDLNIFSKDLPTHLQTLIKVFSKLHEAGLKVKIANCEFFLSLR